MPLYVYHCNACSQDFEKIVSFAEAKRLPACPHCLSQETQKKISNIASTSGSSGKTSTSSSCGSGSRFS